MLRKHERLRKLNTVGYDRTHQKREASCEPTMMLVKAVITTAIRLRYDYDPTTTYRARLLPFDAIRREQKWTCQFFVVVVSQSNRNCDIGLNGSFSWFLAWLSWGEDSWNGATTQQLSELDAKLSAGHQIHEEVVDEDQFVKLRRDGVDTIGQSQARSQCLDAPRRDFVVRLEQKRHEVRESGTGREDDVEQRDRQKHRGWHCGVRVRRRMTSCNRNSLHVPHPIEFYVTKGASRPQKLDAQIIVKFTTKIAIMPNT